MNEMPAATCPVSPNRNVFVRPGVWPALALCVLACSLPATTRAVDADIYVNVKHAVGGVDTFDRSSFITIHGTQTQLGWSFSQADTKEEPFGSATDDFSEWREQWKLFIDMCGRNMDFWTIHLYDWPCIHQGEQHYRRGSNLAATFDLIDPYGALVLGQPKLYVISEYGAQMHNQVNKAWSAYRDGLFVKSVNDIARAVPTDFMGREKDDKKSFFGLLEIPVPFDLVKDSHNVGFHPITIRLR